MHRHRKSNPSQDAEWTEEPTVVYRAGPRREGSNAWAQAQSLDAVFERARASGEALPTAFVFAVYVQACAELAGTGRRPARHREDRRTDPELGPDRIYVGFDGQMKIDWARDEPEEDAAASSSQGRSTRRSYLSPEQLRGLPTNGRSDLYSLALCTAELFVLKRLSDGRGAIADSEGWAEFAELLRSGTRIPREVGSIFLRSLARDIEQRPLGVTLLLEDLERIGPKLGLRVDPSTTAAHMRRLFLDPRTEPPPPLAPRTAPSEYRPDVNAPSSLGSRARQRNRPRCCHPHGSRDGRLSPYLRSRDRGRRRLHLARCRSGLRRRPRCPPRVLRRNCKPGESKVVAVSLNR